MRWARIPNREIERYAQMMETRRWEQERAKREEIVTLAQSLGWRDLTFGPAMTCGGTETAWQIFAIQGGSELIDEALRQLRSEVEAFGQKEE
jgi:hypothetical protein